jgi:hypothetical protein
VAHDWGHHSWLSKRVTTFFVNMMQCLQCHAVCGSLRGGPAAAATHIPAAGGAEAAGACKHNTTSEPLAEILLRYLRSRSIFALSCVLTHMQ